MDTNERIDRTGLDTDVDTDLDDRAEDEREVGAEAAGAGAGALGGAAVVLSAQCFAVPTIGSPNTLLVQAVPPVNSSLSGSI